MNHLTLTLLNPDNAFLQRTKHYSITSGGQIVQKRIRRPFNSQPNLIHILETEMNTSISNLWSRGTEYTIKICKLMHNSF